eukprot:322656-Pyramimonas_sp.AAC.1
MEMLKSLAKSHRSIGRLGASCSSWGFVWRFLVALGVARRLLVYPPDSPPDRFNLSCFGLVVACGCVGQLCHVNSVRVRAYGRTCACAYMP